MIVRPASNEYAVVRHLRQERRPLPIVRATGEPDDECDRDRHGGECEEERLYPPAAEQLESSLRNIEALPREREQCVLEAGPFDGEPSDADASFHQPPADVLRALPVEERHHARSVDHLTRLETARAASRS